MDERNFRGQGQGSSKSAMQRNQFKRRRAFIEFDQENFLAGVWPSEYNNEVHRHIHDDSDRRNVDRDAEEMIDNSEMTTQDEDGSSDNSCEISSDDGGSEQEDCNLQSGYSNTEKTDEDEKRQDDELEYASIGDDVTDDNENGANNNVTFMQSSLNHLNKPLNVQSHVTVKDYFLAGLAMSMAHSWTYEATLAYYKWIARTSHHSDLPKTKSNLWKALQRNDQTITRHLYCRECRSPVGEGKIVNKSCECRLCGPDKSQKHIGYFLSISLRHQLEELFRIPDIARSLRYRFNQPKSNCLRDIYDGIEYQKLCEPGEFLHNEWNFSFTFNTDGASISESSSTSAWPIFVQINELPPHLRKKHILLASIWIERQKPLPNAYILPFTEQINDLYVNGVTWKPSEEQKVVSKFVPLIFCADSGARYEYLRMTQFNGKWGCTFCYHKGIVIPGKRGSKYSADDTSFLRTDASIRTDATKALDNYRQGNIELKSVRGVKGPSALGLLKGFDLGKGPVVDTMHNIAGVIKQHCLMFLNDTGKDWYIGHPRGKQEIENIMLSIKFPSRISRRTRELKYVKAYKCSEWRNFAYYGLVCLENILPKEYLEHLALLFEAVYILNSDCITPDEINYAEDLLKRYVFQFEFYFGTKQMTYNIHLLTHVCQTVRNWGPMWVHNAYPFESMNRKIIRSISSPTGPALQVYTRFLMNKFIQNCAYDETVSHDTRRYISELLNVLHYDYSVEPDDIRRNRFICLGKGTPLQPTEREQYILRQAGYIPENFTVYKYARINGIDYRTLDFRTTTKFSNSTICYNNAEFGEICSIVSFSSGDEVVSGLFVNRLLYVLSAYNTEFIKKVSVSDEIGFIEGSNIHIPALKIDSTPSIGIIKLPNVCETD